MRPKYLHSLAAVVALLGSAERAEAHKPVTTRYTFQDDVLPVIAKRCGACHRPDGAAPMSLLSYEDARPWAEAMKEQVLARSMPPIFAEPGYEPLAGMTPLSALEIDTIADWSSGGAPAGSPPERPEIAAPAAPAPGAATAEEPSLDEKTIPLSETRLAAAETERRVTRIVALSLKEDRFLGAWDLKPGHTGILRSARLFVTFPSDRVLAAGDSLFVGTWVCAQSLTLYPQGSGRRIPAGSQLAVELRYERPWPLKGKELSDRSVLELYFLKVAPAAEVKAIVWPPAMDSIPPPGSRIVAFYPPPAGGPTRLELQARAGPVDVPAGAAQILLDVFKTNEGWPLMYSFAEPPLIPEAKVLASPAAHLREPGALLYVSP